MAVIGTAVLELVADTAQFKREMATAKGEVQSFDRVQTQASQNTSQGGMKAARALQEEMRAARLSAAALAERARAANTSAAASVTLATASTRAGDGIKKLNEPLRGLFTSLAQTHPVVGQFVQVLGSMAIGSTVMVGVLGGLAAVSAAFKFLGQQARDAKERAKEAIDELGRLADARREAALGPGDATRGLISAARARLAEVERDIGLLDAQARLNQSSGPFLEERRRRLVEEYARLTMDIREGEAAARQEERDAIAARQKQVREGLAIAARIARETGGATGSPLLGQALPGVEGAAAPGRGRMDVGGLLLERGIEPLKLRAITDQLRTFAAEASRALSPLQESLVGVADTGIDAFANFAVGAAGSFKEFANSVIRDLARIAIKLAIFEALNFLFPGSGFVAKLTGGLAGRASGGPVRQGQPYVIGERGPELFVPNASGTVLPHAALAGGGSLPVFDFSRFPPAQDPRAAARDGDWQQFLEQSLDHMRGRGWR